MHEEMKWGDCCVAALSKFDRVIFFGDKMTSAGDVARCVLSACALVCPPFTNVIRRAFPYASLTQLDFLSLKGCMMFINPCRVVLPQ